MNSITLPGRIGKCGNLEVFQGFAPASLLAKISFADVLDEQSGRGYQRRFCREHSLQFKKYIQSVGATTIPLTFNLRGSEGEGWSLKRQRGNNDVTLLTIDGSHLPVMSQVDCQHRLGYLRDSAIEFAFMAFLGLGVVEEMQIFRDINGKAKGLSSSLLDLTEAKISNETLSQASPALAIALQLHEDPRSPWHNRLDLGGTSTTGTKRIASLRTMHKGVRRYLREATPWGGTAVEATNRLIGFWSAIALVLCNEWARPRNHMVCKGIGVYALSSIAGRLLKEANRNKRDATEEFFVEKLSDFIHFIDWSNDGSLKGFGGAGGADAAVELIWKKRVVLSSRLKHG